MADKHTDPLAGLLFGRANKLINLKMCRGDAPNVAEHDLRKEAHFALTQVFLETCDTHRDFPEDRNAKRVDVEALAAI